MAREFIVHANRTLFGVWLASANAALGLPRAGTASYTEGIRHPNAPADPRIACEVDPSVLAPLDLLIGFTVQSYEDMDLDGWFTDPRALDSAKDTKIYEIDKRTRDIISAGFTHNGTVFSLSEQAQLNWHRLFSFRDYFTYPKPVSTKDDNIYLLADATEVETFCNAARIYVENALGTGVQLRLQVAQATTVTEVEQIEDNR